MGRAWWLQFISLNFTGKTGLFFVLGLLELENDKSWVRQGFSFVDELIPLIANFSWGRGDVDSVEKYKYKNNSHGIRNYD